MSKIQAIRGMNDILPAQSPVWQFLEETLQQVVQSYGYQELRFPVLEQTQLFRRSIGEVTDIVEKEMYSFEDRNGDSLSLRPEGTAGCVRAAEQHGMLYNQQQRLWYRGPMFRYERPQKGRYRQFHQFGVENFGMAGPDIDAELILMSARMWRALGLSEHVRLELNNIGQADDRRRYGEALTAWLSPHKDKLDADSQRRLDSNPLRILDSKDVGTQELLADAPVLSDYLNADSVEHFAALKSLLDELGVAYVENPRLVRGLDYYNNMVFEWITDSLGAQGTVCAGGRYDSLVAQLGGRSTPATGFAIGLERLVLMLEAMERTPEALQRSADVYIINRPEQQLRALHLAEQLREALPQLRVLCHCGGGKSASQMKKAYNSGARVALILQEDGQLRLRMLAGEGEEQLASDSDIVARLGSLPGLSGVA